MKKKIIIGVLFIIVLIIVFFYLNNSKNEEIHLLVIEPNKVPCTGVGPQECLIVNDEYFYDPIEGFDFVEGYSYEIKVKKIKVYEEDNVPADASLYKYELIKVISKEKGI